MDETAPRFLATLRALQIAHNSKREGNPTVVFDVVPHRIYETCLFERFRKVTEHVDVLISEVSTMRRFLGLGYKEEAIDRATAEETGRHLKPYYNKFVLRWGPSGCDEQLLWDGQTARLEWEETGHRSTVDKRGFGDALAVRALRTFFEVLPDPELRAS